MTSHDQLWKDLFRAFFPDLLFLVAPGLAACLGIGRLAALFDLLTQKWHALRRERGEMPNWPEVLQAQKSASTVLVLFVPSVDRFDQPIEQEYWVAESLSVLGRLFEGATAFPQGRGVWRDDARGGQLIFDAP